MAKNKYELKLNIDRDIENMLINSKKNVVIIKDNVEENKKEVINWISFDNASNGFNIF